MHVKETYELDLRIRDRDLTCREKDTPVGEGRCDNARGQETLCGYATETYNTGLSTRERDL